MGNILKQSGKLRIIGGRWRGRNLCIADEKALRPTANRIRETLFNWLREDVVGARCLDLFAGSGALGIEAVSRGAVSAVLVDHNRQAVKILRQSLRVLGTEEIIVHQAEALQWIKDLSENFDIIFLDPPFGSGLVEQSLSLLLHIRCVTAKTLIYVESERVWQPISGIDLVKHAKAGQVHYALLKVVTG